MAKALTSLPPALAAQLFDQSKAARWGLSADQFGATLEKSVAHAFTGRTPSAHDVERYVAALHLDDLALSCACAAGSEAAWDHFIREYRPALYRAADAIEPGGGARDLADALYADLFGLKERDGVRQSLFRYFHGRSSLSTWLRAVLAQRHVDRLRAGRRLDPLPDDDSVAVGSVASGSTGDVDPARPRYVELIRVTLTAAIAALPPRDRLRLSCYYVQDLTLAAIGRMLREHEGTVSRHLTRTRAALRAVVEERLRADHGLDAGSIAECLRSVAGDPGSLDLADLLGAAGGKDWGTGLFKMKEGSMDPRLRKAFGAADAPVSAACVDAEQLAAWSEGALPAEDSAALERHMSTCGRCQAMAAVFARIDPPVLVKVPFWHRMSVRWLVPLTAAAAATFVMWLMAPPQPAPDKTRQVASEAKAQPKAEPPAAPPAAAVAVSAPPATVAPPPVAGAVALPQVARAVPPAPTYVPPPPAVVTAPPPQTAAAPPPPTVAPPEPKLFARPPVAATTADMSRPAAAGALSTVAMNEAAAGIIEIVAPPQVLAQSIAPAAGGGGGGRGGGGAGAAARAASRGPAPLAPPLTRWRILPSKAVERSTTDGASWEPIAIEPPVTLTGGVAASPTICWLIGRGGVVLRAVDGVHFERVTFPEAVDLASIRSTGAAQARVTTADGRVFVTVDGGLTWRLQGSPASSF